MFAHCTWCRIILIKSRNYQTSGVILRVELQWRFTNGPWLIKVPAERLYTSSIG